MWGMSRRRLRQCVDAEKVVEAIRGAERASSGEIRVSVSRFFWGDVERAATRAFRRLHMEATADRNGVLIFLVPSRRRFVVLGDEGIHAKVGQAFWDDVAACLAVRFRGGAFTEGLVEGIRLVGDRLADHFPNRGEADVNELSDDVDFQ